MNVAFFVRHFTERGTEIAIYDYAHHNELYLNNKSIVICFAETAQRNNGLPSERVSYDKFKSRFPVVEINNIADMSKIIYDFNIQFFYTLTHGGYGDIYQFENKNIWGDCKTIKHSVFDTKCPESDFYISISNTLNVKNETTVAVIPHIVNLPDESENLRASLGIPVDAVVIGRYGGFTEFNIHMTHEAIKTFLTFEGRNTFYLFMNTQCFCNHPNVIYLDKTTDVLFKTRFINTCDAMIHSRTIGETFGLSIAEFSIKNKPIITCEMGDLEHVNILGEKAILYNSADKLVDIFKNIKDITKTRTDWNAYAYYSPENIMKLFDDLIFSKSARV